MTVKIMNSCFILPFIHYAIAFLNVSIFLIEALKVKLKLERFSQ